MIRAQHKPSRVKNPKYLEWIRKQPCVLTPVTVGGCQLAVEANHILPYGGGKTGSKTHDRRALPFCGAAHHYYHRVGRHRFESEYGIGLEEEILRLNKEYDTLYPVKRETRQRHSYVKDFTIPCECKEVHKVTPGKAGEITSTSVKYWCRRRQTWMTARF